MIYRLNDEFTKIEETEGLLQNRSDDVEIEFVVCKENPQKDSGAILVPSEKYTFAVKEGESVYARSNKMTGALANLAVLNFKKPASGGVGAGDLIDDSVTVIDKTWSSEKIGNTVAEKQVKLEILYSGLAAKEGTYNFAKSANQYSLLLITTPGDQAQVITRIPGKTYNAIRLINKWDSTYQIWLQLNIYETYFEIVSNSIFGNNWGFNGIYQVIGIK